MLSAQINRRLRGNGKVKIIATLGQQRTIVARKIQILLVFSSEIHTSIEKSAAH